MIKIVVGLGNPGPKYAKTRHNAGFWFIDEITQSPLSRNTRFRGEVGQLTLEGQSVHLLKPETFMNNSGESLLALAHFYKIAPEEILVVHDELDLPPGTVRLKAGGGHGGHNGLRSIISHLGSKDFKRLRIGIGHPGDASEVVNYVLSNVSKHDENLIYDGMDRARSYLADLISGKFESVMNNLHRQ